MLAAQSLGGLTGGSSNSSVSLTAPPRAEAASLCSVPPPWPLTGMLVVCGQHTCSSSSALAGAGQRRAVRLHIMQPTGHGCCYTTVCCIAALALAAAAGRKDPRHCAVAGQKRRRVLHHHRQRTTGAGFGMHVAHALFPTVWQQQSYCCCSCGCAALARNGRTDK